MSSKEGTQKRNWRKRTNHFANSSAEQPLVLALLPEAAIKVVDATAEAEEAG